jgi:hypothetical protein
MACFITEFTDIPSGYGLVVLSEDGYAMKMPVNAFVKIIGADGVAICKRAVHLAPGDLLVLNMDPASVVEYPHIRARMWLLGMLTPAFIVRETSSIVTTRMDFIGEILAQMARASYETDNEVTVTYESGGGYRVKSRAFSILSTDYDLAPQPDVHSSFGKIREMQYTYYASFIAGIYASVGSKSDAGDTIRIPTVNDVMTAIVLMMLLKYHVRAKWEYPNSVVLIEGRANVEAFESAIAPYRACAPATPAAPPVYGPQARDVCEQTTPFKSATRVMY